ncbi:MAG: OmpH family outer membrane protein [Candidatus Omnitrophota bacterium]|nr:OmpH family outer membrane protein [Candidatus Omnitrophota bacterium]
MKKIIVLLTALLFVAGLFISPACEKAFAKEYKIGYVDLAKVFDEYKKTKESEKLLEEKGKAKEADRKKYVDELRKLKDEQSLLSEKAKAEKQKAIDDKIKTLQDFDRTVRDELMKERNDRLAVIMKDIENVVTAYAKETGYDLIANSRALLYGSEQYDLTKEVLSRLNK